ncbi:MAG: hypothetical protein QM756_41605 [Polyangiaceae bacterium]
MSELVSTPEIDVLLAAASRVRERAHAIGVFTDAGPPGMPRGICRQTLLEFARPECQVIVASLRGLPITPLGALLSEPFTRRT